MEGVRTSVMSDRHNSCLADRVAEAVLSRYSTLPAKFKPVKDSDGLYNWVPLSGIVFEDSDGNLDCVSLATGMKCLPASKVSIAHGRILHDSHAEVLALRTFNHFLTRECGESLKAQDYSSKYLRRSKNGLIPFTISPSIKIHMYCSEAPCGDASMEVVMQRQDDATPWSESPSSGLLGRGHFSELGIVRRKPSRGDSPESLSKSCSDKLALKQCTSILSSHASRFVEPDNAYLTTLVIPESQYVASAFDRCFGSKGRMSAVTGSLWPDGYSFRSFYVLVTTKTFEYSRLNGRSLSHVAKPSNLAAIWNIYGEEVIINGVLQGRKQIDPRGASMVSRFNLNAAVGKVNDSDDAMESKSTYAKSKENHQQLLSRAHVKREVIELALTGWVRNVQDDFDL